MKNTVIYGEITVFGTPERTLTSDLPLRRRTLYTTELLGHISDHTILIKLHGSVKEKHIA